MKTLIRKTAVLALVMAAGTGATFADKLRVVATTPDLAALAREIGGDKVEVTALAKPTEDPHFVDPKPSHVVQLNKADVLIEGGAELELGWLPPLLESARNRKVATGSPGRIVASQGIRMADVPTTFDRSKGDVHSLGNPHFLLDPANARIVATRIAQQFSKIDAASAPVYQANLAAFLRKLDTKTAEWEKRMEPHRGAKLVTYHRDFVYLADRYKLQVIETLEPKPGIAPSPAHIARVVEAMKGASARVIVVQPYQNKRTAETVARQTRATVLEIPQQPGVRKDSRSYFDVMDYMVTTLANAFAGAKP